LGSRRLSDQAKASPGQTLSVLVRPETLTFSHPGDAGAVAGVVETAQYSGSFTEYRVRLPDQALVSVQAPGPARLSRGGEVALRLADDPLWPIGAPR
jgi:ABC-type Fe3+/spermidine/putrescine transport system ATPase subunit